MDGTVELGDRVKDRITGMTGIVYGISNWLYGCRRITVQPEKEKDGKPADTFCVDEPQLRITKKAAIAGDKPVEKPAKKVKPKPTGGPREDAKPRR